MHTKDANLPAKLISYTIFDRGQPIFENNAVYGSISHVGGEVRSLVGGEAEGFESLNQRRQELGLSVGSLAKRSGVSRPTVQRILSGTNPTASFSNVMAIAHALGLSLRLNARTDVGRMKQDQAARKARKLVSLVQGTLGLEGQAVDQKTLDAMIEKTTHEMLNGPKRRLWSNE
jgi:transcriptional regulator with XRE-family HTH domain